MSIPVENIYRLILEYTISGNRLSTGLDYAINVTGSTPTAKSLAEGFVASILPLWQAAVSQDVRFQQVYVYNRLADTDLPWSLPLENQTGSLAFDSIPSNCPAVMRLMQLEIGGRHNGRIFISGVSEADVTDGYITDAAYTDHWDALRAALYVTLNITGSGEANLVVLQTTSGGTPITPVGHLIQEVLLNRAIASLRKRTTELREIHT